MENNQLYKQTHDLLETAGDILVQAFEAHVGVSALCDDAKSQQPTDTPSCQPRIIVED